MRSLQCCSCHSDVAFVACDRSDVAEIAAMLQRSQRCSICCMQSLRQLPNTWKRSHATNNEMQKMCHVALPKDRQSGVSRVQQGGLNLTDNTPEFASSISLFCRCCCPVVPSNASSYHPSRCPPSYCHMSVAISRCIVNQRLMQQMRHKKCAISCFRRAGGLRTLSSSM
jgi:hypothetical protein